MSSLPNLDANPKNQSSKSSRTGSQFFKSVLKQLSITQINMDTFFVIIPTALNGYLDFLWCILKGRDTGDKINSFASACAKIYLKVHV